MNGISSNFVVNTRKSQKPDQQAHNEYEVVLFDTNLADAINLSWVDIDRTTSSDSGEVHRIFGIDAARNNIVKELAEVMNGVADMRHIELIARVMTADGAYLG